jgi:protein-disulfide isomerase
MSTDTAFALGVLALVAGGATRLRVRLLTIAVVDDLVALVVIAVAYSAHLSPVRLVVAAGLFAALLVLRYAPLTWRAPVAMLVGVALWLGGVVAGVGFTVSLLIASIAFRGERLAEAKVGVLAAALIASLGAWAAFRAIARLPAPARARQLSRTANDVIDLSDEVDHTRDHVRGGSDAAVTLIEYGDYECPYCGQAEVVIRQLLGTFGDELCYVWRHLPLNDVHPNAQLAAEAAEAAAAQNAFWPMHDTLLDRQEELTPAALTRYAADLGLDVDRFWDDVHGHRHADHIAEDVASADASGVAGTPSFFINGRRHEGAYDLATLTNAVQAARRRASAKRVAALTGPDP